MKRWKVGDKLILHFTSTIGHMMYKKNIERAILKAWSEQEIIVQAGDGIYHISYGDIQKNKSLERRDMESRIRETMGKPEFNFADLVNQTEKGDEFFDGKHLELMSEVELQVYLKKALDEDKYEEASKIRDQMKKFR